mgnify:FL=1
MTLSSLLRETLATLGRGPAHESRLANTERTVVVSGTRGKSAATRWLYEILYSREADVLAKITGNRPLVLYDGETHPIERSRRVTLYENERELRRFAPVDTLVLENQAIGEYTTRLVHERFADPDVIFLTNVRRDHLDRLGRDPLEIARAFGRTIPEDTTLVVGEQRDEILSVLEEEVVAERVSVRRVTVPERADDVPGAETIYGLNEVLEAVGEAPLSERRLAAYVDEMRVDWTVLPGGRVYNAASVNDVDSTEIIRQALATPETETIQPFVYLRADRRARTVSFIDYLDGLYDEGVFELARAVGPHAELFARHASFPVATHDESESPARVLDAALDPGWPVFIVGNTVAEFMRELDAEIESRELDRSSQQSAVSHGETTEDQH